MSEFGSTVAAGFRKLRGLEPAPPTPAPPEASEPETSASVQLEATPGQSAPAKDYKPEVRDAEAINVKAACSARDETGYREDIAIEVADGEVKVLSARVDVPRRGFCRFDLSDFRQTRRLPHVELAASSGSSCVMFMWEQEGKVTVAANECAEKCTSDTFDYVWPLRVDAATGSCS
ncbi:MAG: hypothetical protein HY661_23650 [Betaproteobacteria bacterium]|nr:hypothetical protein [Betaproteobacteria bacterium]